MRCACLYFLIRDRYKFITRIYLQDEKNKSTIRWIKDGKEITESSKLTNQFPSPLSSSSSSSIPYSSIFPIVSQPSAPLSISKQYSSLDGLRTRDWGQIGLPPLSSLYSFKPLWGMADSYERERVRD